MILDIGPEAREFGKQALRAFEAAGGDQLVQRAEADPQLREKLVRPVLESLGAWDLDVHDDTESLEAAGALSRSAGYWAVPYPVAEHLSCPADLDEDGLVVIGDHDPLAALGGLSGSWAATSIDGDVGDVTGLDRVSQGGIGREFVVRLDLSPRKSLERRDVALALVLPCWTLLGMLDRAMELTTDHIRLRTQFGQTLSTFQGVQFQLTDAEVERSGLEILAKHALWSIGAGHPEALDDALALRLSAIEAAETVFRVCHQLHGAVGFCDETTLSWLSRYSQPLRRLPTGLSETRAQLARRIGKVGLTGLFGGKAGGPSTSGGTAELEEAVGAAPAHGAVL